MARQRRRAPRSGDHGLSRSPWACLDSFHERRRPRGGDPIPRTSDAPRPASLARNYVAARDADRLDPEPRPACQKLLRLQARSRSRRKLRHKGIFASGLPPRSGLSGLPQWVVCGRSHWAHLSIVVFKAMQRERAAQRSGEGDGGHGHQSSDYIRRRCPLLIVAARRSVLSIPRGLER